MGHVADRDGPLRVGVLAGAAGRMADRWAVAGASTGFSVGFDTTVLTDAVARQATVEEAVGLGSPILLATEPTETAVAAACARDDAFHGLRLAFADLDLVRPSLARALFVREVGYAIERTFAAAGAPRGDSSPQPGHPQQPEMPEYPGPSPSPPSPPSPPPPRRPRSVHALRPDHLHVWPVATAVEQVPPQQTS